MKTVITAIRKDLADPCRGAVTCGLLAALIALVMIALIAHDEVHRSTGARAVDEEDQCAPGTLMVERYHGQLYCLGEP